MYITHTNGQTEEVKFDKISDKIQSLVYGLSNLVDPYLVTQKTIEGLKDGMTTTELDSLSADIAANLTTKHPDYGILANRIWISRLHKRLNLNFTDNITDLYNYINPRTGEKAGLISDIVYNFIIENKQKLNETVVYQRDFDNIDYFGLKKLESGYLLKMNNQVAETPQQMWLRVSCGIWYGDLENTIKTYNLMSQGYFTHATPTLFNAGTKQAQLSSCFLQMMDEDSLVGKNYNTVTEIGGIYKTLADTAALSKGAGGIGIAVHNIRSRGSYIKSTGGQSNGLIPMLKVFNETARYVDQGGGKRKGSFAIYLEPWHADIFEFLDLRKNTGKDEIRARDLYYALWMPDLFMKRVEAQGKWTLFDPAEIVASLEKIGKKPLWEIYGEEFEEAYTYLEQLEIGKVVQAEELWKHILETQVETGMPYITYKDAVNKKSNQKNLGTIKSSNLCAEVVLYTDKNEVAVCNLASLALPKYIENGEYNHQKLYDVVYQVAKNINRVIDINYYPIKEAKYSNLKNRPIAIGVQGLADVFHKLKLGFTSSEAKKLNKEIFETMYFAALKSSCDLAKADGAYETFAGSPASQGILQYDMWGLTEADLTGRWDYKALKEEIKKYGLRNSQLISLMPTASTSVILGNNESFEPYTYNIYLRRVLNGEIKLVNPHLVRELIELNLWNQSVANQIIQDGGSVLNIKDLPDEIKERYKTVWELKVREIVDMSADRGAFVCQTQSFNHFVQDASIDKLHKIHLYGWKKGLKTGSYYIRTRAALTGSKSLGIDSSAAETISVTKKIEEIIDEARNINATGNEIIKEIKKDPTPEEILTCSLENPESCEYCSS